MLRRTAVIAILALAFALLAAPLAAQQVDPDLLAGMKARSIGPAGMSGRVADVVAVRSNPNIIYVGAATGGVWRSRDAGLTWEPLFDDQPVAAIGAVAVFQPHPDIVWVGTGEGNPRNSASVGNGIYKSLDGGDTWTHLGLEGTERIHRIVLHPSNPQVAYVAAMGQTWGENAERGIFKTEDGGRTWTKVLYVDPRTGAADLEMDPSNPNKLLAAMWDYRRWPWFFRSGGPGSGLYLTVDGGATWKRQTEEDGLPAGDLGRIGLAFAPSDPRIAYALVEAKNNVLLRSEDGGRSWKTVNAENNVANRPFYYADLRVDPEHPNRVYNLYSLISVSNDGGKTFEVLVPFRDIHPDHHAMWIHPDDGRFLIAGNDGGVAISRDRGHTWRFVPNLPLAQYYHIRVDMDVPYNVYGGMQDNGSWRGPSSVWENGGIRNHHWEEVGFGDGFDTVPDPRDSLQGYAMSQQGFVSRWNLRTGERKDVRPSGPDGVELRFNWNAGIAIDPFDPATIYYGSQFVHKSADRGDSWTIISPDLTTNNPEWQKQKESGGLTPDVTGAENFTTIITIAPSPIERGVLWVGTDDGRIHVTRDGGGNWSSVEGNLHGVPANTWVPHIEPSRFAAGTAFAVFDNHRRSDWTPYVFKTTDFGRTWTSLATPEISGYALAIARDPVAENLLFLGTEFGLYVSLDGGRRWMKWTHGFPTVSAMDLLVHPREHDLVIGTHGRAAYILDDIRPLRSLTAATLAQPVHLFDTADAQQYRVKQTGAARFPGHTEFRGENRPYGALLTFSLNDATLPHPNEEKERARKEQQRQARRQAAAESAPAEEEKKEKRPEAEITVADEQGEIIRTFKHPAHQGLNRAVWDLRRDAFKLPPRETGGFFGNQGPEVLAGTYRVTVKYGEQQAGGTVRVLADPRFQIADSDRRAKAEAIERAGALQELAAEAITRILGVRADMDVVRKKIEEQKKAAGDTEKKEPHPLVAASRALEKSLGEVEKRLWNPPDTKGIAGSVSALQRVQYVLRSLGSSWDAPTPAQLEYLRQSRAELEGALADFNALFAGPVADFRRQVGQAGITILPEKEPLRLP